MPRRGVSLRGIRAYREGVKWRQKGPEPVVHTVTTAPMSLADDSDMRMRRYLITMGIRTSCFLLAVVFEGWLRWVFVAGAAGLPYIAVVLANAVGPRWGARISGADRFTGEVDGLGPGATIPHGVRHEPHVH
jgi:hypothetical protein